MTTLEREQRVESLKLIGFIVFMLVAFGIAGACDYHDEQAACGYWAERGVSIQRW